MAATTRAFIAGVGTTFVVLAIGFGGGLIMAKSALKEPSGYQTRAASERLNPVRVVLPNSAEAAQPPQPSQQAALSEPAIPPAPQLVQAAAEKPEPRKPDAEEQERKRRYAERKARSQAEARRVQRERQSLERVDAPVMAYSGDNTPRF